MSTQAGSLNRSHIAVVIINFNGLDDSRECLRSLRKAMDECVTVVVVDNGSSADDALQLTSEFGWARVIAHPINAGWSGGNNVGIRIALEEKVDWVLLLNNDTLVAPEIFERLRRAAVGGAYQILGPVINEFQDRSKVQTEGVRFNPSDGGEFFSRVPVPLGRTEEPTIVACDIVNGCSVMIAVEVFKKIGLIDERFFLICEESDFCLRALEAGFRCGVISESLVWHKQSVSFARAGSSLQRYYGVRNLRLLLRRHSNGLGRRSAICSWFAYHRYAYHLYCHDWELGGNVGATATVAGWLDGFLRIYGPRRPAGWIRSGAVYSLEYLFWLAWLIGSWRRTRTLRTQFDSHN